ncbi:MAG TPA: hypothetical protein VKX16_12240 [Chloroflexota bacterium]|nr:hypothetical protein [Chloroflexota bacterium]
MATIEEASSLDLPLLAPDMAWLELTRDPRSEDLPDDSRLWSMLFLQAYEIDGDEPDGLFGSLHGIRCLGAQLVRRPGGIEIRGGCMSAVDYARLRREYLIPRGLQLRRLLERLSAQSAEQTPAIA